MTNHPNRSRPNLMYIENGYAYFVTVDREQGFRSQVHFTSCLHYNRYVRVNDGHEYPQLCKGGQLEGGTLIYYGDEQLARDCRARLFKTRVGFDRAVAKYQTVDEWSREDDTV
jgi:hypothetical protein